mmetsp:Transcript_5317/g.12258  ORF Transcript_5317/g.12258 Transcript_5317/m.12258 type:complete len:226 (-) Transcript_5317:1209-1886(-)
MSPRNTLSSPATRPRTPRSPTPPPRWWVNDARGMWGGTTRSAPYRLRSALSRSSTVCSARPRSLTKYSIAPLTPPLLRLIVPRCVAFMLMTHAASSFGALLPACAPQMRYSALACVSTLRCRLPAWRCGTHADMAFASKSIVSKIGITACSHSPSSFARPKVRISTSAVPHTPAASTRPHRARGLTWLPLTSTPSALPTPGRVTSRTPRSGEMATSAAEVRTRSV